MRWTLLKAYEQAKRVKVKLCEESAEELKKQPNELELRYAIYRAERRKNELSGMIYQMEMAGVITEKERGGRKGNKGIIFAKEVVWSKNKTFRRSVKIYGSEIKKRAKKSGTFLSPVDSGESAKLRTFLL